jgi:hypothetical protein
VSSTTQAGKAKPPPAAPPPATPQAKPPGKKAGLYDDRE